MNKERDKFLTEAMGDCWHECPEPLVFRQCKNCNHYIPSNYIANDFSTWKDFGKLWNWANEQIINTPLSKRYLTEVILRTSEFGHDLSFINPEKFADAVYHFLKDRK